MSPKFSTQDISVVIPTYNRPEEIRAVLEVLKNAPVGEIVVVDQSKDDKTKLVCNEYGARCIHSRIPSITIARNLGARRATGKLICFIDDDVMPLEGYFEAIADVFNTVEAKAVAGYDSSSYQQPMRFKNLVLKLFRLSHYTTNKAEIVSGYGNTYPKDLKVRINAQWLPGLNMVYRREIFKEFQFDENFLGYALAEDTDFNYRLWQKYPKGLYITPNAKLVHKVAQSHRTDSLKRTLINHVDHWYFNYKNLNKTIWQKITWVRCLIGVILNSVRSKDHRTALIYCFKNRQLIQQGRLREFVTLQGIDTSLHNSLMPGT